MPRITRRDAISALMAVSTASAASLLTLSSARADAPGAPVPGMAIRAPRARGLKAHLTPGDREINRRCINKTLTEAPNGATWSWRNPKTGNRGTVTPTSPPARHAGQTCRTFRETVTLKDGRTETISGRACKRADGSWEIAA